jgi:Family of unknown function (DUF5694)
MKNLFAPIIALIPFFVSAQSNLSAPISDEEKTQILILASPHLSSYKDLFSPETLSELNSVLFNWQPDHICVESLSPLSMHTTASNSEKYSSVIAQFGRKQLSFGEFFQDQLNCSWGQAMSRYDSIGRRLQVDHEDIDNRIAFTMYAFASYRFYTGLLQWSKMTEEEKERLKLPTNFHNLLLTNQSSANESVQIGMALAKQLGLEEIHQIDDHLDKDLFMRIAPALVTELSTNEEYSKIAKSPFYRESREELKEGLEKGNLFKYYKAINSDSYQMADLDVQWKLFYRTQLESKLDQIRVGLWEVRNLNIASNIRRSSSLYPGKKILVIIGSSHKIFLDNYLKEMMGVKMVNLNQL